MEKSQMQTSALMLVFVFGLFFQNLVIPVMAIRTFDDQKNFWFYPHDPPTGSPPSDHGGHSHVPTPSHGGGGSYSPPSHGGGSYSPPSHSTPSHGNCGASPSTPSHGGSSHTPATPTPDIPTPTHPTPSTPHVPTPTHSTPSTPHISAPPSISNPNSPFSCNYWRTHPGLILRVFGYWGTLGSGFGVNILPVFGADMSFPQALSNTRTDGYGTLYREGTASLLNSMVTHKFPYTTNQVRESFIAALGSNEAAAAQGTLFKLANEGKLH